MFKKFDELDDKTKGYLILGGCVVAAGIFVCAACKINEHIIARGVMKAFEQSDKVYYVVPHFVPELLDAGAKIGKISIV